MALLKLGKKNSCARSIAFGARELLVHSAKSNGVVARTLSVMLDDIGQDICKVIGGLSFLCHFRTDLQHDSYYNKQTFLRGTVPR